MGRKVGQKEGERKDGERKGEEERGLVRNDPQLTLIEHQRMVPRERAFHLGPSSLGASWLFGAAHWAGILFEESLLWS